MPPPAKTKNDSRKIVEETTENEELEESVVEFTRKDFEKIKRDKNKLREYEKELTFAKDDIEHMKNEFTKAFKQKDEILVEIVKQKDDYKEKLFSMKSKKKISKDEILKDENTERQERQKFLEELEKERKTRPKINISNLFVSLPYCVKLVNSEYVIIK